MTRAEHVAWAKRRALAFVDRDEADCAIASLLSDLNKHPETANSVFVLAMFAPFEGDTDVARHWIGEVN